jgi:hypothetical protein
VRSSQVVCDEENDQDNYVATAGQLCFAAGDRHMWKGRWAVGFTFAQSSSRPRGEGVKNFTYLYLLVTNRLSNALTNSHGPHTVPPILY